MKMSISWLLESELNASNWFETFHFEVVIPRPVDNIPIGFLNVLQCYVPPQ